MSQSPPHWEKPKNCVAFQHPDIHFRHANHWKMPATRTGPRNQWNSRRPPAFPGIKVRSRERATGKRIGDSRSRALAGTARGSWNAGLTPWTLETFTASTTYLMFLSELDFAVTGCIHAATAIASFAAGIIEEFLMEIGRRRAIMRSIHGLSAGQGNYGFAGFVGS